MKILRKRRASISANAALLQKVAGSLIKKNKKPGKAKKTVQAKAKKAKKSKASQKQRKKVDKESTSNVLTPINLQATHSSNRSSRRSK